MSYDIIILDSSPITQWMALELARAGQQVAIVIAPNHNYRDVDYYYALQETLAKCPAEMFPHVVNGQVVPLKTWRQNCWQHIRNQVFLELETIQIEFKAQADKLGIDVYHGTAEVLEAGMVKVRVGCLSRTIETCQILQQSPVTNQRSVITLPSFMHENIGYKDLLSCKQLPQQILLSQTDVDSQEEYLAPLRALAFLTETTIVSQQMNQAELQFGITTRGTYRLIKNQKTVTEFDMLWTCDCQQLTVQTLASNNLVTSPYAVELEEWLTKLMPPRTKHQLQSHADWSSPKLSLQIFSLN
jgi:hypothetical protein